MTTYTDCNGYGFVHEGDEAEKKTVAATNAEQSSKEVEAFKARAGDKWFAYWKDAKDGEPAKITTWVGDVLATVTWAGHDYKSPAFGGWPSTRRNFRCVGVDGRKWFGTYYVSSGSYVRIAAKKG